MVRKYIFLFISLFISFNIVDAQKVSNVVAQKIGNSIEITYTLDKDAEVRLLLSQDGGRTYSDIPKSLVGDVGEVQAGNRRILWNLLQDGTEWNIPNALFKVEAELSLNKKIVHVNGIDFTMIMVDGGSFYMGCAEVQGNDCESDEKPSHYVTLDSYYIGQTEVTQELWKAVMGNNPSSFKRGNKYPVENVSWDECQEFIRKLNELTKERFTLPTEAQWEFAAIGGTKTKNYKYSGSNNVVNVAWFTNNSLGGTHPVAQKEANELGLYDMSGNVWEWCADKYGNYSATEQINPRGTNTGSFRVYRGGSWNYDAKNSRVSKRNFRDSTFKYGNLGLRLVLPLK